MSKIRAGVFGGAFFAAVVATAYPFIIGHEGERRTAYVDPVGVVTVCAGHTRTARLGQRLTEEQCRLLFEEDFKEAFAAVERHVRVPLTPERAVALSSFVFNLGETQFRNSTLVRRLNAGDTKGACDEFMRWIYAGGKVLHGLTIRRADERALCLQGINNSNTK